MPAGRGMTKREPAPGETAEALLLELRATMLLAQRRQLRAQRRGFQTIAARLDWEMQETIRSDATWPEPRPAFSASGPSLKRQLHIPATHWPAMARHSLHPCATPSTSSAIRTPS